MKTLIRLLILLFGLAFFLYASCKKDSPGLTSGCKITSVNQNIRRVDVTYDEVNRPIEIKDNSDTSYADFILVRLTYNEKGLLNYVRINDKYGVIDSLFFEYVGNSKIKEHRFNWSGLKMVENSQRCFVFNSQGYLSSDTIYAIYIDASELTLREFSVYDYDNNGNVLHLRNYYRYNNLNTLDYTITYEYSENVIPGNSYSFVRYVCLAGSDGIYPYFYPHCSNLLINENYNTSTAGNYSISHTFEFNARNYPVKEFINHPQYPFTINFNYQCD
jgi:hypothetical protein